MTLHFAKQRPLSLRKARKTDLRVQFGALVYRIHNGKAQVLLITTRRSQSWSIPKGWPMSGKTPADCAMREAWEEAGVKGTALEQPLGFYSYFKTIKTRGGLMPVPVLVSVYPVALRKMAKTFPESGQRRQKWMRPKKAAAKVREPELARILRKFDPAALPEPH